MLEICDRTTQEQVVAAEKHLANVDDESDFEEDLAAVTGKEIKSKKENNKKGKTLNSHNEDLELDDEEIVDSDEEMLSDEDDDDLSDKEGTAELFKHKLNEMNYYRFL